MVVNVDVVVLSRDGLLYKGFGHDLISNLDRILVDDPELRLRPLFNDTHTSQLQFLKNSSVESWATITIHDQSLGCLNADLVQNLENVSSIPKHGLHIDFVDAKRGPQLNIFDRFAERETF